MSTPILGIPANRQSLVEIASCPHSYAVQIIEGRQMPGGMQSARGTEIHQVMSRYIAHCAHRKVVADWAEFDRLALGAGPEAAQILNGLRDSYAVDFEHVYETELNLGADEGEANGTLDVLLFPSETIAKIEDFKSHPRPFEPDTDQSKRYAFLVFKNFPQVEAVTFELIFVRYANCRRSVEFTREDLPALTQQMVNSRLRQERIHADYEAGEPLPVLPGKHCQYCPLLQTPGGCPIAESNPHATSTPEEWGRYLVWLDKQRSVATETLKDIVDARGTPVQITDGNGRVTNIGFREHESKQYPLLKVLPLLMDYREATPGDIGWLDKLLISSTKLKSYLKAKKRSFLHQCVDDTAAEPVTKVKFGISVPAEVDDEEVFDEWEG